MKKTLSFVILALFLIAPMSPIHAQTYQTSTTTQTVTTQSGTTSQMITIADIKAIAPQLLQTLNQLSIAIANKQNQILRDQTLLGQAQAQQEQVALNQVLDNVANIISLFSNLVSTVQR
ncbi:MAG: hypothetical protein WCO12_01035 [bacterium]